MKKSLIALAALAATSAFAQSSVTLYGRAEAGVDLGYRATTSNSTSTVFTPVAGAVVATNAGGAGAVAKPGFRIQDGNNQGLGSSRFGMRGTEDLGGGLKANFVMEAGLNLDDGSTGNGGGNFFSRSAWVGLSGGFGEVRLGRQVLGSFAVHANGLVNGSASGLYETGTTMAQGGVRFSNAIQYRSSDFGGISGTVSLSAPENRTDGGATTTAPATRTSGDKIGIDLSVAYANGPIYVGFGYNKKNKSTTINNGLAGGANVITDSSGPRTDYTISASYNFGVAQPFFNYTNRKDRTSSSITTGGVFASTNSTLLGTPAAPASASAFAIPANQDALDSLNTNGRQYALGVKVPLGAATLVTSFGTHKTTGSVTNAANTATDSVQRKVRAFQVGGFYPLSKRTTLMANYGFNDQKDNVVNSTTTILGNTVTNSAREIKVRGLNVGVQHLF